MLFTLEPGDIILTGTREGAIAGHAKDKPVWLKPGSYQECLPWQELAQLRLVAFQPMLASSSLIPLLCVTGFTVVEL